MSSDPGMPRIKYQIANLSNHLLRFANISTMFTKGIFSREPFAFQQPKSSLRRAAPIFLDRTRPSPYLLYSPRIGRCEVPSTRRPGSSGKFLETYSLASLSGCYLRLAVRTRPRRMFLTGNGYREMCSGKTHEKAADRPASNMFSTPAVEGDS